MSISSLDNLSMHPLGAPGGAERTGIPADQPARPLDADSTRSPPAAEPDAQELLASEAWPSGPRLFDLPALATGAAERGLSADELDRIAANIVSHLT